MSREIVEKIIREIRATHREFPDMSLGNILQKSVDSSKKTKNVALHNISEKKLLDCIKKFKTREMKKRARNGNQV